MSLLGWRGCESCGVVVVVTDTLHDIFLGGVTLLRAAAKNHARVSIVSDPKDYNKVIEELKAGQVTQETRNTLALKVYL